MTKEDIIRKLTSRKFWMAIIGFVTPLLIAFGVSEETVTQVAGIIMSGATAVAYIVGEGMVDAKDTSSTTINVSGDVPDDEFGDDLK